MKRSYMLKVIKDALYCHLPQYKECPNHIAEAVLMSIEGGNLSGEGMLPPKLPKNTPCPHSYTEFFQGGCNCGTPIYEWEKEDS